MGHDPRRGTRGVFNYELAGYYEQKFRELGFEFPSAPSKVKVTAVCGFCKEKEKSAQVTFDLGTYQCFRAKCGETGVVPLEGDSYTPPPVKYRREPPAPKVVEYSKPDALVPAEDAKVVARLDQFFADRGISKATVERAGVEYVHAFTPGNPPGAPAIAFPYYRDGEHVNTKYRGANKAFRQESGAELIPYNLDVAREAAGDYVVVVEGEIDALSWIEAGVDAVISAPNGGSKNLDWLTNGGDWIGERAIVCSVDHDEVGDGLYQALSERFAGNTIKRVQHGEGNKDANDLLLSGGMSALKEALEKALDAPIPSIVQASDWRATLKRYVREGDFPKGERIGVSSVDDLITWRKSELSVILGYTGQGKSNFLDFVMVELALRNDYKFAVVSIEKPDPALHSWELINKAARVPMDRMADEEQDRWMDWVEDHFFYYKVVEWDLTLESIVGEVDKVHRQKHIDGVVLDNLTTLSNRPGGGENENTLTDRLITQLGTFAKSRDLITWVVCHARKPNLSSGGKLKAPTTYDASGSAAIANKADNIVVVHRDDEAGIVEIITRKIRWSWIGKIGKTVLKFVPSILSYREVEEGEETGRSITTPKRNIL